MNRTSRALLILAASILLVAWEVRALRRGNSERVGLRRRSDALQVQVATLHRRSAAIHADLAAGLSPQAAHAPQAEDSAARGYGAWLVRLRELQAFFARHPDQVIPEMCLLQEIDWLRVSHDASLDDAWNFRRACAAIRRAAKMEYGAKLAEALQRYESDHGGSVPSSSAVVASYLSNPELAAALGRYTPRILRGPNHLQLIEFQETAAPVDSQNDSRIIVNSGGGMSVASGPQAWGDQEASGYGKP